MWRKESIASEYLALALAENGIQQIFEVPGTQTLALSEGFRRAELSVTRTCCERGAAYMANGYFRATGRPAAVCCIPGPGFSNTLTAVAEADSDSAALLIITSHKNKCTGPFPLQKIPEQEMIAGISRGCFRISSFDKIDEVLEKVKTALLAGEPGPVYLSICSDLISSRIKMSKPRPSPKNIDISAELSVNDLDKFIELIKASKRPALLLGMGAHGVCKEIAEILKHWKVPVLCSASARGALSDEHPYKILADFSLGLPSVAENILGQADQIFAFSYKFTHNGSAGNRLTKFKNKITHLDSSENVLSKAGCNTVFHCTLESILPKLLTNTDSFSSSTWQEEEIRALKLESEQETEESVSKNWIIAGKTPAAFFLKLNNLVPDDIIVVTDSGLHQGYTRSLITVRSPYGLITPTDFQAMGFGIPAAIGAAHQSTRPTLAIVGDGGMLSSLGELAVASEKKLNLVVMVFVDGFYGQIRLQQEKSWGHSTSVSLPKLNLEEFASSISAGYSSWKNFRPKLFKKTAGLTIVEIPVSYSRKSILQQKKNKLREAARDSLSQKTIARFKK